MAKQIWVRKGQEVRGPFSLAQIRQLAADGKLTARHELSSDRKRWIAARAVGGLEVSGGGSEADLPESSAGIAAVATSQGGLFAIGVVLLVANALMVTGVCLLNLGLVHGAIFAGLFLLAAVLGYPAACLGREMSAIYIIAMALISVVLLGEARVGFGSLFLSWGHFAAGLVPGSLIILGWMLVVRGLGHDHPPADFAGTNPARFWSAPLPADELERAARETQDTVTEQVTTPVALRLDPDDVGGVEDSLGEVIEQEARRTAPGLLVSLVLHAVLLAAFAIWRLAPNIEGDFVVDASWTVLSPDASSPMPPERRPIELQAVNINQEKALQPVNPPPEQPVDAGPLPAVPVRPVDVGKLFEGRNEQNRRRIRAETENGPEIEQAISQGLAWLARHQEPGGQWRLHEGYPDACEWPDIKTDTGATALALLAFLGHGQTHKNAKNEATQQVVQKGLDWLLRTQQQNGNGDFHDLSAEEGRNPAFYAHSQATIAVCEAYVLTKDRRLYEAARLGVEYLLKSQQPNQGGWRYHPLDARSIGDLSVTGWALMALHSARAAGIEVPDEPFQRVARFLDSVQEQNGARYKYQPAGWQVSRAMTAEGLLCRQFLGWPRNHPPLQEGIEFLLDPKYQPRWSEGRRNVYEWYYVGHVLHNMNDEEWIDWYNQVQREIVANQVQAGSPGIRGSWHPHKPAGAPYELADKAGRLYITAMSLLILEMPVRHQPIYRD